MQLARRYSRVSINNDLQSPILRQILDIWDSKREGRPYPSRDDVRPQDFAPFLRHLSLARVVESGKDFEIRIVGDEIVQAYGENLTGRTLSSLTGVVGEAMLGAYHATVMESSPVLLQGFFERTRNHHFRREVVLMPLGSAGAIDFVLSAGILIPREVTTDPRGDSMHNEAA